MTAASIVKYMFMLLRNSKETVRALFMDVLYGTEVCGRAYFCICICIIASTSLPSKFQDFPGPCTWISQTIPGPNLFSRTFQVLETLQTQFQDFPGGVGALLIDGSRLRRQHQCCDRRSIDALLLPCVLFVVVVHTDSCRQLLTDCGEQWYPLVNTTALQHLVTPSRSAPTVTTSTTRYSMDSERPQHCCPLASNFEYITHNAGTSQYISLKELLHEVDFDPPLRS